MQEGEEEGALEGQEEEESVASSKHPITDSSNITTQWMLVSAAVVV